MKVYTHVRNLKHKQCTSFLGADGVVGVECQRMHIYSMCIYICIYICICIYVCVYVYTHASKRKQRTSFLGADGVWGGYGQ